MKRIRKLKSSNCRFAKNEEYSRWAIRRRRILKREALDLANDLCYNNSIQTET